MGDPILVEELLFRPVHSLIDQSLHSRLGATTTNGDGFGIGWYGERPRTGGVQECPSRLERPQFARGRQPDQDTVDVRTSARRPGHRCSAATAPFRYGRWLWMHNGSVASYPDLKRDLMMAVTTVALRRHRGSTDSETLFFRTDVRG